MANLGSRLIGGIPWGRKLKAWLDALRVTVSESKTLLDELHDDHATFKTALGQTKVLVDELHDDHATLKTAVDEVIAWAEALATKLNADTGVADTDYDADITAAAPATLTAAKPTASPASLDTYE